MRHPSDGVLRRLVDEPAGVALADHEHVDGCDRCRAQLATTRTDASFVEQFLTVEVDPDVDAGWHRLAAAAPSAAPAAPVAVHRPSRVRRLVSRPAVGALAVGLVLTGAGTAAANDWLQVFRTDRVEPVSITTADLVALPDLSGYGTLDVTREAEVRGVADAGAAASATGLDVPEVADLPDGVTGSPQVQVGGPVEAVFTFSSARAAAEADEPLPPAPPGVEGSRVRLTAGPGVAQVWSSSAGVPALVVGRAVAPVASASGAPFEVVRDHLLSLPGVPDALAEQLRAVSADSSTLPLPVPADRVTTRETAVDGAPATVLQSKDRALAAVVWVDEGVVTVVAGSLDDSEVLEVARELR